MIKKVLESDINQPIASDQNAKAPIINFSTHLKRTPENRLTRNLALAGLLLLTIVSIRNVQLPNEQTILTAVQEIVSNDWGENLGKISFVSNLFPETVAVFFSSPLNAPFIAPCYGSLIHPWTKAEPYLSYQANETAVYAMASGQIMSLAHGPDEEKILRIRHDDGMESFYYQLKEVYVSEGDLVTENTLIACSMENSNTIVEVRREGIPIDPAPLLIQRVEASAL